MSEHPQKRINISSQSELEKKFGYARLVCVGEHIWIAGTTGINYQTGQCPKDPIQQLNQIIKTFNIYLEKAQASLEDIVQLTLYVSHQDVFDEIGPELGKIFKNITPTNTALIVQFPVPDICIEMSATAVRGCGKVKN